MKKQFPTDLPLGYDERTEISLTPTNDIVIAHPVMPPMIYDETVMRWVEISTQHEEPVQ
jgi:hypothetical protein